MLPSHHSKQRPSARANGVYLCAVVSLSVCLLLTFAYWRWEVNSLINVNEELKRELAASKEDFKIKTKAVSQLTEKVTTVEEERNSLTDESNQKKIEIEDLTKEIESLKTDLEQKSSRLSDTARMNEDYSKKLEALQSKYDDLVATSEKEVSRLREKLNDLKDQLEKEKETKKSGTKTKEMKESDHKTKEAKTTSATKKEETVIQKAPDLKKRSGEAKDNEDTLSRHTKPDVRSREEQAKSDIHGEKEDGEEDDNEDEDDDYEDEDKEDGAISKKSGDETTSEEAAEKTIDPQYLSAPDVHDEKTKGNFSNPRTGDPDEMQAGMLAGVVHDIEAQ